METYTPSMSALNVVNTNTLPIQETFAACNLATKKEVRILGDNVIHMLKQGGTLYVSPELYEKIKQL